MALFKNRPLFCACMIFILFSVIGYFLPYDYKIAATAVAFLLTVIEIILLICKKISNYSSLYLILCTVAVVVSMISSIVFFNLTADSYEKHYGKEVTVQATVIDENFDGGNLCGYRIQVETVNGEKDRHIADLECYYDAPLQIGDHVTVLATAEKSEENGFGRYSEKLSKISDGVFVTYLSYDEQTMLISDESAASVKGLFSKINSKLSHILTSSIKGENGRLASAILLGNRELVSNATSRDFSRAGVSHILAISGMHMGIIMGAFMQLLKKFRLYFRLFTLH